MKFKVGCDLVQIKRIEKSIQNPSFVAKVFHPVERSYCEARASRASSYAARFAAKEALAKAIGTGFYQKSVGPLQIWIENAENGAPHFCYEEPVRKVLAEQGFTHIDVSLSHDGDYALATVIVSG